MELVSGIVAATVASAFTVELWLSWRARRRLHAEAWTLAFAAYSLGTWALVAGLAFGWSATSFRFFYFFGAIANIPLLAVGAIALVVSERAARRFLAPTLLWVVVGFFATFLAPLSAPLLHDGVPEGSDVFGFSFVIDALTLPGPRMFAAVSGAVGSVVIIGLSLGTIVRNLSGNRRLVWANILIIGGVLAPAFGGTLTAFGDSAGLSMSLMIGITLLWAGYRMATGSRRQPVSGEIWEISVRALEESER
ncbi:MAG: hypothetical protein R2823_06000 [Acidimicrobiia bacterium]